MKKLIKCLCKIVLGVFLFALVGCKWLGITPDVVDYLISSMTINSNPTTGATFSGEFVARNAGDLAGAAQIAWTVYRSDDADYDAEDVEVQSGTLPSLGAGESSSATTFSGEWPDVAGICYLIVQIAADDDSETTNNSETSSAINVELAGASVEGTDYLISNPGFPSSANTGATLSGSFEIANQGDTAGTEIINWHVYVSDDAVFDGGDPVLDSATRAALAAGTTSAAIAFSGSIAVPGTYYLIIAITATDDDDSENNDYVSSALLVTVSPRFVAVGDGATIGWSDDAGDTWTVASITPSDTTDLADVAQNSGRLVAVGVGGAVWTSDNGGVTWSASVSGTSADLTSIAFGNGQFVAVGDDGANGVALFSTNGVTWSDPAAATGITTILPKDVAFGANRFVATDAKLDWSDIRYSTDGVTWTSASFAGYFTAYDMTFDGSYFFAAGTDRNMYGCIQTSPDGITWANISFSSDPDLHGAGFDGIDRVVTVGEAGIVRYSDGGLLVGDWTQSSTGVNHSYGVAFGASTWVAVGEASAAWYSLDDGAIWAAATEKVVGVSAFRAVTYLP